MGCQRSSTPVPFAAPASPHPLSWVSTFQKFYAVPSYWKLVRECEVASVMSWLFAILWTVASTGSSVHGILQAGILEWVALPSFRGSSWSRDRSRVSYVSCIDRRVLYHWATWETLKDLYQICILQWLSLICSGYEFNKIISHIIWRTSPVVYCARAVLLRFYQACELPGGLVDTKSVTWYVWAE